MLRSFFLSLFARCTRVKVHDTHTVAATKRFHMIKVCCWIMLASLIVYVRPFLLHISILFSTADIFERESENKIFTVFFFSRKRKKKNFKNRRRNERNWYFSFAAVARHDVHDFWYSFYWFIIAFFHVKCFLPE